MQEKLKRIRLLILDVDGVMTDGKIIIGNNSEEFKFFDVKDGLGIKLLQKLNIKIAIITGKTSKIVKDRFSALGVTDIYQGQQNKLNAYQELLAKYKFEDNQVAYIGDDLPDLPLLNKVGFSIMVADGHKSLKAIVDHICKAPGGKGALREVCDLIYDAHNIYKQLICDFIELGESKDYVI